MSADGSAGKRFHVVIYFVLIPIVVTIIGGIVVEWLKPRVVQSAPPVLAPQMVQQPTNSSPTPPSPSPSPPQPVSSPSTVAASPLTGKWKLINDPTYTLEFMTDGKVIRSASTGISTTSITTDDKQKTRFSFDTMHFEVLSLSEEELRLHVKWTETISNLFSGDRSVAKENILTLVPVKATTSYEVGQIVGQGLMILLVLTLTGVLFWMMYRVHKFFQSF